MINFNELGIKAPIRNFEGDKIKMDRILNKPIVVQAFKVGPSKFSEKGSGKLLTLQILYESSKRIVFTGSCSLIEMISQVPTDKFPITTTITRENEQLQFS